MRCLHAEVQGWRGEEIGHRAFVYNDRARDRYNQPVASLVILADDDPRWRPSSYADEVWGTRTEFRFRVVKLLDWEAREAELWQHENPAALFVLAQLFSIRTRKKPEERAERKLALLRKLYERGVRGEDMRQWYRYLDWLLSLPQEYDDAVYQQHEREQEGAKVPYRTYADRRVREEGKLIGSIGARLEMRFGQPGLDLVPALDALLDLELLRRLETLPKEGTLEEVQALLPVPTSGNGQAS